MIELKIFVPLNIDKKQQYGNIVIPENVTSVFLGKPQIFGLQINTTKFAKYLISKNLSDEINIIHAHFVFSDGSIALKLFKKIGVPYVVSVRGSCILGFNRKLAIHNFLTGLRVLINAKKIFFQSQSTFDKLLYQITKSFSKKYVNSSCYSRKRY
jgi:hypothetical protein